MITQPDKSGKHRGNKDQDLMTLLVLTVTLILLFLILTGSSQTWFVVLATTIIVTVLILAITGNSELLPDTLKAILSEIRRIFRS
ncbi:MAG: hypothetical protein BroJett011_51980 [Chloroflexota bacterium]|nr:MAG: hypothetical protein BroJett011_51980 [Chloroflexota bacterium]